MKKGLLGLFCSGLIMMSSQALALVDGQLLVGQRSTSFDADSSLDVSGQQVTIAAHLDPIPLVPVGFGAYLNTIDFDGDGSVSGIQGGEIGIEATAWLPLDVAGLTPYAKLGYTLAGGYVFDYELAGGQTFKSLYNPKGTRLAAGVKWSPLPLVALMFEVAQSDLELSFDKLEDVPTSVTATQSDLDASGLGVLLGVEVGI
jgi:hypothetical protein